MRISALTLCTLIACASASPGATAFISEFHYDNAGTDTGEFVEVYVEAGTTLADVSVVLYNGNGGAPYNSETADNMTAGSSIDFGGVIYNIFTWSLPSNGIQNGAPDGIAIGHAAALCEFISYEGSFAGVGGIADGITSIDIIASQGSATTPGSSIERIDGGWESIDDGTNSAGLANPGLTMNPIPEPSVLVLGILTLLGFAARRRR